MNLALFARGSQRGLLQFITLFLTCTPPFGQSCLSVLVMSLSAMAIGEDPVPVRVLVRSSALLEAVPVPKVRGVFFGSIPQVGPLLAWF